MRRLQQLDRLLVFEGPAGIGKGSLSAPKRTRTSTRLSRTSPSTW